MTVAAAAVASAVAAPARVERAGASVPVEAARIWLDGRMLGPILSLAGSA